MMTSKLVILDALTYAGNLETISQDIDNERCFFVKEISATVTWPTSYLLITNLITS